MSILPERAVMPPLGLLTVAALCPPGWQLRLVDCAFEELMDQDLLWADLVLVSGMTMQRRMIHEVLGRARRLGRRTMIGGPHASNAHQELLPLADHVVVGEPDEIFGDIAYQLEQGTAQPLYEIAGKPDLSHSPLPRFDLLQMKRYGSMAIQFSRGCPYRCEFCDIVALYGRRPRTKHPELILAELNELYRLGWRRQVHLVDDNFIGNHRQALILVQQLQQWQERHDYPFTFYTEASIDLAKRTELVQAMVRANFLHVFVGIESPSQEALREIGKLQNLSDNPLQPVHDLLHSGLWVSAGFIAGFDSDGPDIFDRQAEFIERGPIPWAMIGLLQISHKAPIHDRMQREARLLTDDGYADGFQTPNFRTKLPTATLLGGFGRMVKQIYTPDTFYDRAWRSLTAWRTSPMQRPAFHPLTITLRIVMRSIWQQGFRSNYRRAYWRFLLKILWRYSRDPLRFWMGWMLMISGHHMIRYAADIARQALQAAAANTAQTTAVVIPD